MKEITKEIKDYLLSVGYPDKEKISYLEVWLWLWREKEISIDVDTDYYNDGNGAICFVSDTHEECAGKDPEEAIEQVIKHLVDNNLIR